MKQLPALESGGSSTGAILYIKLVLTAVFWGGTFIAARIIAQEAGPFSAAFLRFLVASFFLMLFVMRVHGRLPMLQTGQILPIVVLGMTGVFAYNFFFFSGLKLITASRASLIVAANPAFIALLSAGVFSERLHFVKIAGIALSVSGAAIVISQGNPQVILHGDLGLGELYILGCVASWTSYSLIGKAALKSLSPLLAVTYACIIGAFCLLFPALSEGILQHMGHYSANAWLSIFYLGFFGSALGFIWYYEGIKRIGPSRAGVFINIVPVSSILLASLILNEVLDASLAVGALFVILGVYFTNRSPAFKPNNFQ